MREWGIYMSEEKENQVDSTSPKVGLAGWLSLAFLVIMFSGVFAQADNFLRAFDFGNLTGTFGKVAGNADFHGKGGTGAREGMMYGLTLLPTVMLAVGLIDVVEAKGGLRAAEKLFRPILRPLLGIPGLAGIAFIASFTSSDVAAVMTKELVDNKQMTDAERSHFLAYQYAGSAVIMNLINTQAPLLPIVLFAVGPLLLVIVLLKIMGANIMRLYTAYESRKVHKEVA